ncbi:hypothetical protein ABK040_002493 [Willaertia magna]
MKAFGLETFLGQLKEEEEEVKVIKELSNNITPVRNDILSIQTGNIVTPSKLLQGVTFGELKVFLIGPDGLVNMPNHKNIPFHQLEIFKLNHVLGSGAFSSVFYAKHEEKSFALKQVRETNNLDTNKLIWSEFKAIYESNHPNLIKVHECYFKDLSFYMLLDFCNCGSLRNIFKVNEPTERMLSVIVMNILKGLNYLQKEKHIIHRDIKPENILINYSTQNKLAEVKIGDFGLCGHKITNMEEGNTHFNTMNGTYIYMSPERLNCLEYNYNSDIWSLGIMIIELMCKIHPFENLDLFDIKLKMDNITNELKCFLNNFNLSNDFKDFVLLCCEYDYKKRPFAEDLLKHAWLTKFNDENTLQKFNLWIKMYIQNKKL